MEGICPCPCPQTLWLDPFCRLISGLNSNDVSNSIGPFAAILEVFVAGTAEGSKPVPLGVLIAGGAGIGKPPTYSCVISTIACHVENSFYIYSFGFGYIRL